MSTILPHIMWPQCEFRMHVWNVLHAAGWKYRTQKSPRNRHLGTIAQIRYVSTIGTKRPASADRTARRQFQATGQPVSRTQASDAMTSRLPRCEAKCVQRRCFQCGAVPLRSDIKGTELPTANILIPLERQLIALQLCRWVFLYNETLQQTIRPLLSKLSKRRQI